MTVSTLSVLDAAGNPQTVNAILSPGVTTAANSRSIVPASDSPAFPVSAVALPLPTGAATQTTLAAIASQLPASLGAKTTANSMAVNLASDQFTKTSQMPTGVTEFEVSVEITRAANTAAYAANQVVNGTGASTLPALDLSALIGANARAVQLNSATVMSNNGGASVPFQGVLHLLNVNNPSGQTVTDQAAYNPSYAVQKTNRSVSFENISTRIIHGAAAALYMQTDVVRNAVTDATGKFYAALVTSNAYTPASGETITIALKGYLLS